MALQLVQATRQKSLLRMCIDGPAKSGKTYTVLRLGFALAKHLADTGRPGTIAGIETEHESINKYVGDAPDGIPFQLQCAFLKNSFNPLEYIAALELLARHKINVALIDGLSQAWEGVGGTLETVSNSDEKNNFARWKDASPQHRRLFEAILAYPGHVLCTMRSRMETVLEEDEKGRKVPRKIGLKPVQREGVEYEFDICGSMDQGHFLTIAGSRCHAVDQSITLKPGADFMRRIIDWLEVGVDAAPQEFIPILIQDDQLRRIIDLIRASGKDVAKEKDECFKRWATNDFARLTPSQGEEYEKRLQAAVNRKRGQAATAADAGKSAANVVIPPTVTTPSPSDASPTVKQPAANGTVTSAPGAPPTTGCDHDTLVAIATERSLLFTLMGLNPALPDHKNTCDERWAAILAKRGVKKAKELTAAQAVDLLANLQAKVKQLHLAKEAAAGAGPGGTGNQTFQGVNP